MEPRWTLLYVLREVIGLTGTKEGCSRGECGACTVLIDDIPRYACMTLAVADEGRGFDTDILETRALEEATFGLFHIRERLVHIGERVTIASAPDAGTCITLTCPLQDV